jgi:hypothetical protein
MKAQSRVWMRVIELSFPRFPFAFAHSRTCRRIANAKSPPGERRPVSASGDGKTLNGLKAADFLGFPAGKKSILPRCAGYAGD